jgi:hypothetical protein
MRRGLRGDREMKGFEEHRGRCWQLNFAPIGFWGMTPVAVGLLEDVRNHFVVPPRVHPFVAQIKSQKRYGHVRASVGCFDVNELPSGPFMKILFSHHQFE